MTTNELFREFQYPGAQWRGKPFWSWNGELDKEELIYQSHIFKEMGFGGYFMHSRAGLITEYLSDEWFDLINATADAGEKDGLEVWLYDEDRYPSGSAGGKVTENPAYRMKSLTLYEMSPEKFSWDEDMLSVYAARIGDDKFSACGCRRITREDDIEKVLAEIPGEGEKKILVFRIVPEKPNSNYNGNTYLDTMNPSAVRRFLELTHEEYKKKCAGRIGKSIKGIFTDEPHRGLFMCSLSDKDGVRSTSVPWTDDIFDEFSRRYGYDVIPLIPELFYRMDGEMFSRTRVDYIDLTCNLFHERFSAPVNEWCEKNNMIFTGHYLHENTLTAQTVPNGSIMRSYLNMGYPGIDSLTEYDKDYWIAKQLSSVCRQMNKPFMLSELYGCTGWEFPLRKHKIVGDWQALFGVNVRCPHLSWYTMEGESKRDYPASISYQSSYHTDYDFVESYFARFGLMMTEGKADCDVLFINPIESAWGLAHIGWAQWVTSTDKDVRALEKIYSETFHKLIGNHIDFDYGEEQIMSEAVRIARDESGCPVLEIGEASYRIAVVSGMLTMRKSTLATLRDFLACGGKVVFAGELPMFVGGLPSDDCRALLNFAGAVHVPLENLADCIGALREELPGCESVTTDASGKVFMQVRKSDRMFIAAFVNTDPEAAFENIHVSLSAKDFCSAQVWDLETGARHALETVSTASGVETHISLAPAGSRIVVFTKEKEALPFPKTLQAAETGCLTEGEFSYTLDEPNVCVLDFACMKFGEEAEFGPMDEVLKLDNSLRDRLGIERRGGAMLQPWFAKLNYAVPYGKLTLSYPFFIDDMPEGEIYLAGERPDVQEYYLNGVRLKNDDPRSWWVDNAFKKMRIPKEALKKGENRVTVITDFKRTTNIEAVYLIGNFGVKAEAGASRLVRLPETLSTDDMGKRNLPFYSGRASVIIPEKIYAPFVDREAEKIHIKIPECTGTHVLVETGGKKQMLAWEPWTADVTDAVKSGKDIVITLVNSRRNSFGPLHCVPTTQRFYGPGSFVTSGKSFSFDYSFVPAKIGPIHFLKSDEC